jgi:hypothetical protein
MKKLYFIALVDHTSANKILYKPPGFWNMKILAQAMESALYPFMIVIMYNRQDHR